MTPEQLKERHLMYRKLGSLRATAKHYNVSFQSLAMLFKYHNLPLNAKGGNKNNYRQNELREKVKELSKNHSILEIVKILKTAYKTVRHIYTDEKLVIYRKHILSEEQEKQVIKEYKKKGAMILSKQFNISFPAILSILKRNKIPIRPRGAGSHRLEVKK